MKKWIFFSILSFSLLAHAQWFEKNADLKTPSQNDLLRKKCICNKKCFTYCKFRGQVVRNCSFINKTTISLAVDCSCRALKANENAPSFYRTPKSCLIKPAQGAY